jgi:hypothetical protein
VRNNLFHFAVRWESSGYGFGVDQIAIHDNVELARFAWLDARLIPKLLFD